MRRTALIAVFFALSLAALSGLMAGSAWAQGGTPLPTPRWTPRFTPTPGRYSLVAARNTILRNLTLTEIGVGGMALDDDGSLYVGDGYQTVVILSPDLTERARFAVQQPYALAFARLPSGAAGDLLIGQRNQATLTRYSRTGERLGVLWSQPEGRLETFGIAPDGSVYIVWQRVTLPTVTALTRLDRNGNVMFNTPLGMPRADTDAVHGIAFAPDGSLNITLTGYDYTDPFRAAFVTYTADGQIDRKRPILPALRGLIAPALPARLPDGSLVVFSTEFVTWYGADSSLLTQSFANDFRAGGVPVNRFARRAMLAARPDGRSVIMAEVRNDGTLGIAIIQLLDRLSATPTG